jgi:hypothetical protein
MHKITLLMKPGDSGCVAARRVIELVVTPHVPVLIEEIDLTENPEMAAEYGSDVPVVLIDDVVQFRRTIDPEKLARLFYDELGERFTGLTS